MSTSQLSQSTFRAGWKRHFREKGKNLTRSVVSALTVFSLLPLGASAPAIAIAVRQIIHDLLGFWPNNDPSIDTIVIAIEQMDAKQQDELSKLADQFDAWPQMLHLIFEDQRNDLLVQFNRLFEEFQDELSPNTIKAILSEINLRTMEIHSMNVDMQSQLLLLQNTADKSDKRLEEQQEQLSVMVQQLHSLESLLRVLENRTAQDQVILNGIQSGMLEIEIDLTEIKTKLDLLGNELNNTQTSYEEIQRKRYRFGVRRRRPRRPRSRISDDLLSRLDDVLNDEFDSPLDSLLDDL